MVGTEQVCLAGLEAKQGTVRRAGLNGTCGESGKERTLCKWVFSYTLSCLVACIRHSHWLRTQSVAMKEGGWLASVALRPMTLTSWLASGS